MSEETKTPTAETKAPEGAAAQGQAVDLTVQDLAMIKNIIDVASTRGAFKANELEQVGKTYNKLESFLGAVENQSKDATGEKNG
jgi:hypothetical protein